MNLIDTYKDLNAQDKKLFLPLGILVAPLVGSKIRGLEQVCRLRNIRGPQNLARSVLYVF